MFLNRYQMVIDKQEQIAQSREHFEKMVQDLYSNDAEENNGYSSHSSSECQNEDLKFNKNSPLNNKQKRSVEVLRRWFIDHLDNPYPDQEEKLKLQAKSGMHHRQIQNWFTNSRKRYLEPLRRKFESHGINLRQRILVKDQENLPIRDIFPELQLELEDQPDEKNPEVEYDPCIKKVKRNESKRQDSNNAPVYLRVRVPQNAKNSQKTSEQEDKIQKSPAACQKEADNINQENLAGNIQGEIPQQQVDREIKCEKCEEDFVQEQIVQMQPINGISQVNGLSEFQVMQLGQMPMMPGICNTGQMAQIGGIEFNNRPEGIESSVLTPLQMIQAQWFSMMEWQRYMQMMQMQLLQQMPMYMMQAQNQLQHQKE